MKPQTVVLDGKGRVTVPSLYLGAFKERIVHFSMISQGLLLSDTAYEGLGVFCESIDSANRVIIGVDILDFVGVKGARDEEDRKVIWIPRSSTQRAVEFLLLFGKEGRKTWEQILYSKKLAAIILDISGQ